MDRGGATIGVNGLDRIGRMIIINSNDDKYDIICSEDIELKTFDNEW